MQISEFTISHPQKMWFWSSEMRLGLGQSSCSVCVWGGGVGVHVSCLTLCDPMDCSLPVSSVHGIFPARILEQVAISFSRGVFLTQDLTHISCIFCIDRQVLYQLSKLGKPLPTHFPFNRTRRHSLMSHCVTYDLKILQEVLLLFV